MAPKPKKETQTATTAEETKEFVVKSRVLHGRKTYLAGSTVKLGAKSARHLLALKAIEAKEAK